MLGLSTEASPLRPGGLASVLSGVDTSIMQTEKATYDPDLPHAYFVLKRQLHECGLCGRPPRDELHQVDRQRASDTSVLQTEKGS